MNRKRILTVFTFAAVAATVAVGGTLAWLTQSIEAKGNDFNVLTSGDNMKAALDEPNYDPEAAQAAIPGKIIPKDPTITNTTSETDNIGEWAGAKITFLKGNGDSAVKITDSQELATLLGAISLDFDTVGWAPATSASPLSQDMVFYYKTLLGPGDATSPLFTGVTIKSEADNAVMDTIKGWGGFQIMVDGAVVQGDIALSFSGSVSDSDTPSGAYTVAAAVNALFDNK
ncbi:MAG: hypothetical protein FWC55_10615 [Firmicutes bacterium]|nr:hypothetical protein [Bacillota bacterium]